MTTSISPDNTSVPSARCGFCALEGLSADARFCPRCGYPQLGTDEERTLFLRRQGAEKQQKLVQEEQVKRARNALFWVAGLNMLPYLLTGELAVILVGVVISCMFLGLALWTRKKPFPAILTALVLYVLLILLAAIEDPKTIFSGIIVKVLVLSALGYALRELKRTGDHIVVRP